MSASEVLLSTKMHVPPVPSPAIRRERLIDQLNQAITGKITLVSAPAGFGKTTLAAMWAAQAALPVAWLTLESEDNDLARFLAYLITTLQSVRPDLGADALAILQTPQPPSYETILTSLINDLAASGPPMALILDDYHLIQAKIIQNALSFLLDHLPSQAHLIILTRADPPLPLSRLRARGQLTELRQSDLRFSAEEAADFLNQIMGLDLTEKDVAALETRTEGWIAGLQMAALSLRGHSPHSTVRSEFIHAFTGSHRFILDYLVEEVLDQQPSAIQEFLLKTSILERLTAPLCDQVLAEPAIGETQTTHDSRSILEKLEAANLFIVPLDHERRWYRYHHLFSDLLHKRLLQTYPDLVPSLHRRASLWHEHHGLIAPAINHALAAHDFERAAALIEANVEATLMRSEIATFMNWVERLPDDWVRSHPTLCFFHAWTLMMSGRDPEMMEQRLHDLDQLQSAPEGKRAMAGRMAALHAYLKMFQVDVPGAVELCHQALEQLPQSDLFLRNIMAWILSLARISTGDLQDSKQALEEVAQAGIQAGNPLITVTALCHQAQLQVRQGRLHQAQGTLKQALDLAAAPQGQRLPIASEALMGLGGLELEWNHLDAAAEYLTEAIELSGQWSELAAFDAYYPLARLRLAQGDVQGAAEAIQAARQIAYRSETTELDDLLADLQEANFLITRGDAAGAMRWAKKRGLLPGESLPAPASPSLSQDYIHAHLRKYEQIVLARLLILQRQAPEALDLLEALLAQARQLDRTDLLIQIRIYHALALQLAGQDAQALDALAEALSLAEPGGYVRIFLDEGEAITRLLRRAAGSGIKPAYVAGLLAACSSQTPPVTLPPASPPVEPLVEPLVEALSRREIEILQLLASGLSNPEIASELVVAVSTIRSHCKSIYGKLGVHTRWAAVQRARELGLI